MLKIVLNVKTSHRLKFLWVSEIVKKKFKHKDIINKLEVKHVLLYNIVCLPFV